MNQLETIIDIIFKGIIIGVIVSAPLGPVGILCIQRTINKGRWVGFITGVGAAMSDIVYALLTGYGMSFVFDFLQHYMFYLQSFGSVLLFAFGIYTFRSHPSLVPGKREKKIQERVESELDRFEVPTKGLGEWSKNVFSGIRNLLSAFLTTIANPLIIFFFIALFARLSFVSKGVLVSEAVLGYVAIFIGALLWWFGLTALVSSLRNKFTERGVIVLNRIIGVIVMVVAVICFIFTMMGQSIYAH